MTPDAGTILAIIGVAIQGAAMKWPTHRGLANALFGGGVVVLVGALIWWVIDVWALPMKIFDSKAIIIAGLVIAAIGIARSFFDRPPILGSSFSSSSSGVVPTNVERIFDKIFDGVEVNIDGREFYNCVFNEVTFVYGGGYFKFENATITKRVSIRTANYDVANVMRFLKMIHGLSPEIDASLKSIP